MTQFNLNNLLTCTIDTINQIKNDLDLKIKFVNYKEIEFVILYNNYYDDDQKIQNLKFRKNNNSEYQLICYNFNKIINCDEHKKFKESFENCSNNYEGYEGTLINIFFDEKINEWLFTSSRCLDMFKSKFNSNISHGKMFEDVIKKNDIIKLLDPNNIYAFIIIHHKNKYLVDYTKVFGNNYSKLLYIWTKDKNMNIIDDLLFKNELEKHENIIVQKKLNSLKFNENMESIINVSYDDKSKEINIVRIYNSKYKYLKNIIGNFNTEIERNIYAFQNNNIFEYYTIKKKYDFKVKKQIEILCKMFDLVSYYIFTYLDDIIKNNKKLDDFNNFKSIKKMLVFLLNMMEKNNKKFMTKNFILNHLRFYTNPTIIYKLFNDFDGYKIPNFDCDKFKFDVDEYFRLYNYYKSSN